MTSLFSQIKEDLIMAIYPGCEHTKKDKDAALSCFSKKFGEHLKNIVDYKYNYSEKKDNNEYIDVTAKINLVITGKGNLKVTSVDSPDDSFNKVVEQSIILIDKYLEQANKKIQPAINPEGKTLSLRLSLPITKSYN